ncbi:uncharacterized protein LOC129581249 isoform X2 [Paramacrobiotus metropolitanus]|uniref:uncharacterized protein LOC129581249 isoform X2 n=1 Tax=Paramacrobiotus metropolitanus TaxID=2943436 RepID=UPI002445BDE5|nr:uncharacterized protein LOC129581249 isoform X2 [Paramacrobiotus metropolitanus]
MAAMIPKEHEELLDWDVDTGEFDVDEKTLETVMTSVPGERPGGQPETKKKPLRKIPLEDINMEGVNPVDFMGQLEETDEDDMEEESEGVDKPRRRSREHRRQSDLDHHKTSSSADNGVHGSCPQAAPKRTRISYNAEASSVPKPRSRSPSPVKAEPSSKDSTAAKPTVVQVAKSVDADGKETGPALIITIPLSNKEEPSSVLANMITPEKAETGFTTEGTDNYLKFISSLLPKDDVKNSDRDRRSSRRRVSASGPLQTESETSRGKDRKPDTSSDKRFSDERSSHRSKGDSGTSVRRRDDRDSDHHSTKRSFSTEDRRGSARTYASVVPPGGAQPNAESRVYHRREDVHNARPPNPPVTASEANSQKTFFQSRCAQVKEKVFVHKDKFAITPEDLLRQNVRFFDTTSPDAVDPFSKTEFKTAAECTDRPLKRRSDTGLDSSVDCGSPSSMQDRKRRGKSLLPLPAPDQRNVEEGPKPTDPRGYRSGFMIGIPPPGYGGSPNGGPLIQFNGTNFISNGTVPLAGPPNPHRAIPNAGSAVRGRSTLGLLGPKVQNAGIIPDPRLPFPNRRRQFMPMVNAELPNIDTYGTRDASASDISGGMKRSSGYGRAVSASDFEANYQDSGIVVGS